MGSDEVLSLASFNLSSLAEHEKYGQTFGWQKSVYKEV